MSLTVQLTKLQRLRVVDLAGISAATLASYVEDLPDEPGTVLAIHPMLLPARALAPLLIHNDKPGFVVADMTDLEEFTPIAEVTIPERPLYLVHDIDRGDEMRNWSPNESPPGHPRAGTNPFDHQRGHQLAAAGAETPRTQPLLHDHRLASGQGRWAGSPHAGDLDQRRHRARRQSRCRGGQGRMVLGRQPPHLARIRVRSEPKRVSTEAGCMVSSSAFARQRETLGDATVGCPAAPHIVRGSA